MQKIRVMLCLLVLAVSANVQAELNITVNQGVDGALPIAIAPFVWESSGAAPESIHGIVKADLARSGRFAPLKEEQFAQRGVTNQNMELRLWREQGIDYLVVGSLTPDSPSTYVVKFQLFSSQNIRQLAGFTIPANANGLRMAAHQISDLIYEAILKERGAFNTRLVYVTSNRSSDRRYIMQISDSDGFNARTILNSPSPLMSPVWSPNNDMVAFVSFENDRSGVYVQNVRTGQRSLVSRRKGINGAPAWSPDGSKLAITLSEGGSPDIYVVDLRNKQTRRLTSDAAIDTEPTWLPDGSGIVFTSNRSGKPQIYRVGVNGGTPQRLSFEGDYNAAPSVSADGKLIAMVNGDNNRFRIAVLDIENGQTRVLTNGTLDESPSFAPNGSIIIYATKKNGQSTLAAVSADGQVKQTLSLTTGQIQEPDWSGFLN